jgi:hypothetical protein
MLGYYVRDTFGRPFVSSPPRFIILGYIYVYENHYY